jgi:hypothetical protein
MKRCLVTLICLVAVMVTTIPSNAQTRSRRSKSDNNVNVERSYDVDQQDDYNYEDNDDRTIWQKHRDKITTAGGAAGGAIVGGMAGGKKGAVIGAIAGGAAAALYTYKLRKKKQE